MKARKEYTKKVDSLDSVVETPMNEGREVILDHTVHSFSENGILLLEEFVARINPLLYRLFNEPSGNDERIIIGELSRLGPVFDLSG